jgi:acetylornithine deacetylase
MPVDVLALTKDLVAIDSVSARSNGPACDRLEAEFRERGFEVERLEYDDAAGVRKVNLVAKKGEGTGGLAFLSHIDTVPGTNWDRDPWTPVVEGSRLIGLGACDMKGPLAATFAAAAAIDAGRLKAPILVVAAADEEVTMQGARQVAGESKLFRETAPRYGVVAEPTMLIPVYAHKGGAFVEVVAEGVAAHTSLDRGISATFLIAPFLAEMAELAERLKSDPSYRNDLFDPPTLGFNMTINDGDCRPNVTAARTVASIFMRPMPNDRSADVVAEIVERAEKRGFKTTSRIGQPFFTSPDSEVINAALAATGAEKAQVVPYGTEAGIYQEHLDVVILGPGDIGQAHTNGEWIELAQLHEAVNVYTRMIERLCM